mgnify:FL=1
MGNLVLKGHISYATKRKYKWVAEFGKNTCEKCAALHGQEFDEDEVPYWPHPNCRCKVEEISVIDEIESEINEYKEEIEQLKLQANELLGDTRVLREQIEKLIKEAHSKEANSLEGRLTRLEYDVYKLIDKIESLSLDTIDKYVIQKIEKQMDEITKIIEQYLNEYKNLDNKLKAEKLAVDSIVALGSKSAEDAAALWDLASSKFKRGLDYIEKNGKIINKIDDLKNNNLQKVVRNKLEQQINKAEARGVYLNSNSSLSKSISSSLKFKRVINNNKEKLLNGEIIAKVPTFLNSNWNNFLSINGCDILNIRIENEILYATILDTVDYNPNDIKVKLPRDLQEGNAIENYYIIIEIAEPVSKYFDL